MVKEDYHVLRHLAGLLIRQFLAHRVPLETFFGSAEDRSLKPFSIDPKESQWAISFEKYSEDFTTDAGISKT